MEGSGHLHLTESTGKIRINTFSIPIFEIRVLNIPFFVLFQDSKQSQSDWISVRMNSRTRYNLSNRQNFHRADPKKATLFL
jgi:hypothetical protein